MLRLPLEELVGLSGLGKLGIHKLVLPRQRLNVLSQLIALLRLDLDNLRGLLHLLSEHGVVLSQHFDLVLSFKQPPLEVVFLTRDDRHLMLHVRVVKHLFLESLLGGDHFLSLLVKFILHIVKLAIQSSDRGLQFLDLTVLDEQLLLVVGYVVHEDLLVRHLRVLVLRGGLESLDQLLFVLVQAFNQALEPFNLLAQNLGLLLTL